MERPRDIKEGGASPGKVPRQAYGEGPGRKRSGPPSMNRYIRAGRSCDSGRARLSCFVSRGASLSHPLPFGDGVPVCVTVSIGGVLF